jgi:hypothetical protein
MPGNYSYLRPFVFRPVGADTGLWGPDRYAFKPANPPLAGLSRLDHKPAKAATVSGNHRLARLAIVGGLAVSSCGLLGPPITGPQPASQSEPLLFADGMEAPAEHFGLSQSTASCDSTEESWYLSILWPITDTSGVDAFELTFVQDRIGAWEGHTAGEWEPNVDLPSDATETGLRTVDGAQIWASTGDPPDALYVVGSTSTERWPRLDAACG